MRSGTRGAVPAAAGGRRGLSLFVWGSPDKEKFLSKISDCRRLALQTFTGRLFFFEPLKIFNFSATPAARYLNSFPALLSDAKNWLRGNYRILLYCGDPSRAAKMEEMLGDEYLSPVRLPDSLPDLKGICVLPETLDRGFVLHECRLAVIGTGDLYTKAPDTRRIRRKRGDMCSAPKVELRHHETHGIGKVIGTRKIETTDGTKEYIALEYKDGDVLYVPAEHMDILSRYVGEADPPLSKIGGADFERVKARVRASPQKARVRPEKAVCRARGGKGVPLPRKRGVHAGVRGRLPLKLRPTRRRASRRSRGTCARIR